MVDMAKILPTRVGPYNLILQGDVKGQKVDSEFKIEDVESKSIFPSLTVLLTPPILII